MKKKTLMISVILVLISNAFVVTCLSANNFIVEDLIDYAIEQKSDIVWEIILNTTRGLTDQQKSVIKFSWILNTEGIKKLEVLTEMAREYGLADPVEHFNFRAKNSEGKWIEVSTITPLLTLSFVMIKDENFEYARVFLGRSIDIYEEHKAKTGKRLLLGMDMEFDIDFLKGLLEEITRISIFLDIMDN